MSRRLPRIVIAVGLVGLIGVIGAVVVPKGSGKALSESPVNHVVYFRGTSSRDCLSPENLAQGFGADPFFTYSEVTSWPSVLAAHASEPIDALIVDPGSLSLADESWVARAYWDNTVLVGLDLYLWQLTLLVGDPRYDATGLEPPSSGPAFFSTQATGFYGHADYVAAAKSDPVAAMEGALGLPQGVGGNEFSMRTSVYPSIDGIAMFYSSIKMPLEVKNEYVP